MSFEYLLGENVELEAESDTNREFEEWTGYEDSTDKQVSFYMPSEDVTVTAHFEKEKYELEIVIDGEGEELGYGEGTHDITYDESVTLEAQSDEGWKFVEWFGYEDSTDEEVSFDMLAEDITMTAYFEKEEYTLTVDIEGEGEELNYGEGDHEIEFDEYMELEASSAEGWQFVEWISYEQSDEKIVIFDMPAENITMTAQFEKEKYTLNIDIDGKGEELNYNEGDHAIKFDDYVELETSAANGWKFIEWTGYESSDDKVVIFDMPAEDITMTAHFVKEKYTLNIDIDGEGEELNYGEGDHEIEFNEHMELEASSDTGWQFVEWIGYEQSDDKVVSFDMPAENITMTADFEKEEYTLTVDIDGKGEELNYDEGEHDIEYDQHVELVAGSEDEWKFIEWMGYESSDEKVVIFDMPAEDITMTAHFVKEKYTLNIDIDGEGKELNYGEGDHTIEFNDYVEFEASPITGWEFTEWTGYEQSDDKILSLNMPAENFTMTVNFEIKTYELTINTVGKGAVNVEPNKTEYEHREIVNLTAISSEGHEFVYWTGDFEGTEKEIEITMDDNKSNTAHFDEYDEYDLKFVVEDERENPIEEATVKVDGKEETTNEDGEAIFEDFEPNTYEYGVTHDDYETKESEVEIMDQNVTETVIMEEDENIPGFTSMILIFGIIIAVAIYIKKKK